MRTKPKSRKQTSGPSEDRRCDRQFCCVRGGCDGQDRPSAGLCPPLSPTHSGPPSPRTRLPRCPLPPLALSHGRCCRGAAFRWPHPIVVQSIQERQVFIEMPNSDNISIGHMSSCSAAPFLFLWQRNPHPSQRSRAWAHSAPWERFQQFVRHEEASRVLLEMHSDT